MNLVMSVCTNQGNLTCTNQEKGLLTKTLTSVLRPWGTKMGGHRGRGGQMTKYFVSKLEATWSICLEANQELNFRDHGVRVACMVVRVPSHISQSFAVIFNIYRLVTSLFNVMSWAHFI